VRKLSILVAVLAMTLLAAPAAAYTILAEPSGHTQVDDVRVFTKGHIQVG
jgi:hypothetical protein